MKSSGHPFKASSSRLTRNLNAARLILMEQKLCLTLTLTSSYLCCVPTVNKYHAARELQ